MSARADGRRRQFRKSSSADVVDVQMEQTVVPYDKNLLDRARTQWQFGDWQSLSELNRETIQHHPDRARLALLAATAHLQIDDLAEARQLIRSAQDWGLNNKLISQILAAGVHNSLGRAAALAGQQSRAFRHFESAITVGSPEADMRLFSQARAREQLSQLSLLDTSIRAFSLPYAVKQSLEISCQKESDTKNSVSSCVSKEATQADNHTRNQEKYSPIARLMVCLEGTKPGVLLELYSLVSSFYKTQEDKLHYGISQGGVACLVTNVSGDFNSVPVHNQIPLKSSVSYRITGKISWKGSVPPVVLLSDYDGLKQLGSCSLVLRPDGSFVGRYKASDSAIAFAIGIRLAEEGVLNFSESYIDFFPIEDQLQIDERSNKHAAVITGIPRSGTSLFSVMLNKIEGVVCLNEILYGVDRLDRDIFAIREKLISGGVVPNKYNYLGELTTDTMESAFVKEVAIKKQPEDVVVATKVNFPYLINLQKIKGFGFPVFALVRDPVFTVASWSSEKAKRIPEAQVGPAPLPQSERWNGFNFKSSDPISRRAEIWNYMAGIIIDNISYIRLINYEFLVSSPALAMAEFCAIMGKVPCSDFGSIFNGDDGSRYLKDGIDLNEIRSAVECYAPNRLILGYK